MKRAITVVGIVVLTTVVAVAALSIWRRSRPVTVVIQNEAAISIRSAEIVHEHGSVPVGGIPVGESRTGVFYPGGETAYHLVLVFETGATLKGGGNYAEPGYSFRERVGANENSNELTFIAF